MRSNSISQISVAVALSERVGPPPSTSPASLTCVCACESGNATAQVAQQSSRHATSWAAAIKRPSLAATGSPCLVAAVARASVRIAKCPRRKSHKEACDPARRPWLGQKSIHRGKWVLVRNGEHSPSSCSPSLPLLPMSDVVTTKARTFRR